MGRMERDWTRLGRAIADARKAKGMTQDELAGAVGVGRSTVQSLERGARQHPKVLPTHRAIARVLDWTESSIEAVLTGGEPTGSGRGPTPVPPATTGHGDSQADELLDDLTERVRLALLGGRVVDSDVVELGPDDGESEVVMIWKRGERPDLTPDQRRAEARKWSRFQRVAREILAEDDTQ